MSVCDKQENCVDILTNPCAKHGCTGKKCGEICVIQGDMAGVCDVQGKCELDIPSVNCGKFLVIKTEAQQKNM